MRKITSVSRQKIFSMNKNVMALFLLFAMIFVHINVISLPVNADESPVIEIIVEPSFDFDAAFTFRDGMARVVKSDLIGYVNSDGEMVVPPTYAWRTSKDFSEGYAVVSKDNKLGVIDKNGNITVPLSNEYTQINDFKNGLALVSKKDTDGNELYGFINPKGEVVIPIEYTGAYDFENGYTWVSKAEKAITGYRLFGGARTDIKKVNGKYGKIDTNGNVIVPFSVDFHDVKSFGDGRYYCEYWGKGFVIDFYGQIISQEIDLSNSNGEYTIQSIRPLNEGMIHFQDAKTKKYGYMNANLDIVIPPIYNSLGVFYDGLAVVGVNKDPARATYMVMSGLEGVIDKSGKEVIPLKYSWIKNFDKSGWAFCYYYESEDSIYVDGGLINKDGVIKKFPEVYSIYEYQEGIILATKNTENSILSKYGYLDSNGNELTKFIYDNRKSVSWAVSANRSSDAYKFYNGLAWVEIDGKFGLLRNRNYTDDAQSDVSPYIPSEHAVTKVYEAICNDLIPSDLQNKYNQGITREEFAALVVKLIEKITNNTIDSFLKKKNISLISTITDSKDKNALVCATLGIINCMEKDKFSPNQEVTRSAAASILARTCRLLGLEDKARPTSFSDADKIASWAINDINFVTAYEIMSGIQGKFLPDDIFSREESFIALQKTYDTLIVQIPEVIEHPPEIAGQDLKIVTQTPKSDGKNTETAEEDTWSPHKIWWTSTGYNSVVFSKDYEDTYNDSAFSLKIQNLDYLDMAYSKTIQTEKNTLYKVSAAVKYKGYKLQPSDGGKGGANISLKDGTVSEIYNGSTWKIIELEFNSGGRTEVEIYLRNGFSYGACMGTAWFSDIRIEKLNTKSIGKGGN